MQIDLSKKEFRRLLDMVYIGNWILNSTRGDDRFADYDDLESKLFALCREQGMDTLVERYEGTDVPSRAFSDGGIHEAIADYEDTVFYEILAEELARRDMDYQPVSNDNYDALVSRMDDNIAEFEAHRTDNNSNPTMHEYPVKKARRKASGFRSARNAVRPYSKQLLAKKSMVRAVCAGTAEKIALRLVPRVQPRVTFPAVQAYRLYAPHLCKLLCLAQNCFSRAAAYPHSSPADTRSDNPCRSTGRCQSRASMQHAPHSAQKFSPAHLVLPIEAPA